MITANFIALHFKTERRKRGAWSLAGLRVVMVRQVWDGPLGSFAEIDPGTLDCLGRRKTEVIDAHELLSLEALEEISLPAADQKSASEKKAGATVGNLSP
jgi:hypothetical protein